MEMKKKWIILFCVVVLTAGLSAEKKADCARMELKTQASDDIEASIINQWGSDAPPIKIFGQDAALGDVVTDTLSENEEKYGLRAFEDPLPIHNACPGYGHFCDANISIISRISLGKGRILVLIRHAGGRGYHPGSEGYVQVKNGWNIAEILSDQGPFTSDSGYGVNINKASGLIQWQGRGGCPACACLESDTKIAVVSKVLGSGKLFLVLY